MVPVWGNRANDRYRVSKYFILNNSVFAFTEPGSRLQGSSGYGWLVNIYHQSLRIHIFSYSLKKYVLVLYDPLHGYIGRSLWSLFKA